jgi:hypothetical protein
MKLRIAKQWILIGFLLVYLPGCMYWLLVNEERFQYVLNKGDSGVIAKWTLEQDEGWKLFDGLNALRYKMTTTNDLSSAERTKNLFIHDFETIEDWPADRIFPNSPHENYTTSNLLSDEFLLIASDAYDKPIAEDLLLRIRPVGNHRKWLDAWEKAMTHLEQDRQDARDIAAGKPLLPLIAMDHAMNDTPSTQQNQPSPNSPSNGTTRPINDGAGIWKWTLRIEDMTIAGMASIKQDGNVLRGQVVSGTNKSAEIVDGKIQDDVISFKVILHPGDQGTFENIYSGKIKGDTISGTIEMWWDERPEQPHATIDWNATRVQEGSP